MDPCNKDLYIPMVEWIAMEMKQRSKSVPLQLNAGDVALNAGDVALNAGDVALNAVDVALNAVDVALNAGDFALNAVDFALNAGDVALNAVDVALNLRSNYVSIIRLTFNTSAVKCSCFFISGDQLFKNRLAGAMGVELRPRKKI